MFRKCAANDVNSAGTASSPNRRSGKNADTSIEPCLRASVHLLRAYLHRVSVRCGETAGQAVARGDPMLDERQTLTILSWTLGTVCIGTLVLSALSLH
jgi:hypothetical protein